MNARRPLESGRRLLLSDTGPVKFRVAAWGASVAPTALDIRSRAHACGNMRPDSLGIVPDPCASHRTRALRYRRSRALQVSAARQAGRRGVLPTG